MYRKNTAGQFICVQLLLTATGAVATGLSPAARRCIDGTFAAGGGTFTEDGTTGSYKYALAQADTNGNDISIIVTATGAIPVCVNFVTTAADPTNAATFGITDIDATISSRMATFTPLTAAQIATGVWQDATAGDFTAANSVGKSVINGVALGTGLTIAAVSGAVGSVTGAVGSVTAGVTVTTNNDKTGYSLTQTFPTNFSALGITAGGHITLVDTLTTYTGNTVQTGDSFARLGAPAGASVSADVAAIKSDTGTILTDVNTGAGAIYSRIGAPAGASIAADIAAVESSVTGLNNISTAQVKIQVVAALATDTYAEPAQGTPAATTTLATKISFLYKAWRNKTTQDATTYSLFNDDAATVDHKSTVSDDGSTFTKGEVATGP